MLVFTKGDMFESPVDARVNTVNCVGVMGAGVALAFKTRYPEMFKEYQHECRAGRIRPGELFIWRSLTGELIINFPTKRDWRDPSRYEDIASGLDSLRAYLQEQGPISIAMPALGCGHGGLDWRIVAPMIEQKLATVPARILVFEPADSVRAGQMPHGPTTQEQTEELAALGFKSVPLKRSEAERLPNEALTKGDANLVAQKWVAILPSRELGEREKSALSSIARQIAMSGEDVTVALVHSTRATEHIAEMFLEQGVAVVLILPFGPLTRKPIARTPTENRHAPFAMVSLATPKAAWSRATLAQSMSLLRTGASTVLLSDPSPGWLTDKTLHQWLDRPLFYVRYDSLPEEQRRMLDQDGARPIGRRPDTGEPNLAFFFRSARSVRSVLPHDF